MLIDAEESALLIVDVQERLLPAMDSAADVLKNIRLLLAAATRLDIPVLVTEQYSRGLGATVDEVRRKLPAASVIEKIHFSACGEASFVRRIDELARSQIVLAGLEAHVCVLQTALDLRASGYSVFVAADATASRRPASKVVAETRLQAEGVRLVTSEMTVFEWLRRADTGAFRDLLPAIK